MKRRGALVAILFAAGAGGCSFQHRSEAYACETADECGAGRLCDRGWCVEVAGPAIDADPNAPDAPPGDAFVCPAACDSCDELGTCVITCDTSDVSAPCNAAALVCPAGIACRVQCLAADSCAMGVDCSAASSCEIACQANNSCPGPLACGAGPCTVDCSSVGACTGGVDCAISCSCTTPCGGGGACQPEPICPEGCSSGGECRNDLPECDTCAGG